MSGADRRRETVWLFDLDNTLHNASAHAFVALEAAMTQYIVQYLQLQPDAAVRLRQHYWARYGATMTGLVRHHGVDAAHFLAETHRLPLLEQHLHAHRADLRVLRRLPGRKLLLSNAPQAYVQRVLKALGLQRCFDAVLGVEQMAMFGELRPKPDARMFRHVCARLKLLPAHCVLVEDTLVHQKSARRVGMGTVWMQRWARQAAHGPEAGLALRRRPVYVGRRLQQLRGLQGLTAAQLRR